MDKQLIDQWVEQGTITRKQADVMVADLAAKKKERSSLNLITGISTVGSIVLGLGVILFVASNWQYFNANTKIFLLCLGTFSSLWGGYYLVYINKNYPRVGAAILLLSTFMYCATIFLIAQIYHINANNHQLILLCLLGISPFVYFLKSTAFAQLFMVGFYIWLSFFAFRSFDFSSSSEAFIGLPILFLCTSVFIFFVGGFHYLVPNWEKIARVFRLSSIQFGMLVLLLLTFSLFSGNMDTYNIRQSTLVAYSQLTVTTIVVAVLSLFLGILYATKNPSHSDTVTWETLVTLGAVFISVTFLLLPRTTDLFIYVFNLICIAIALSIFIVGYKREDMALINSGILYISLYVLARYFDFFWDVFDRSIFFIIGGAILVGGGLFLERQRRRLKDQFTSTAHD